MKTIGLILIIGTLLSAYPSQASDVPGRDPAADGLSLDSAPLAPHQGVPRSQKQTDGNSIGLVISNFGFFGNNLVTRAPSMEYPLGSGSEVSTPRVIP
jgi:hypothetical protein